MQTAQLLKETRERRAAALAKVTALRDKITRSQTDPTAWDEATDGPALEAASTEIETIETEVRRLESILSIEARSAGWQGDETTGKPSAPAIIEKDNLGDSKQRANQRFSMARALSAVTNQGRLEGLEKEMHEEGIKEMQRSGITDYGMGVLIPSFIGTRDQTTTAGEGGYTIQTTIQDLIPFLDPQSVVARLPIRYLANLNSNMRWPRISTSATAAWEAEQGTADETDTTLDYVDLTPKRLAAWTDFTMQLMRTSTLGGGGIENMVRERLMVARSNKLDAALLGGAASNAPTGIAGQSGVNTVSVAGNFTWAKIVEMETAVATDNADFGSLAYLFRPETVGSLKVVQRESGTGISLWTENNMFIPGANNRTQDGMINGYRGYRSSNVPSAGTGSYNAYFGNWNKAIVGQWGATELTTDPYTRLTEGTVRIVLNTWHDVAVEHGGAFTVVTNSTAS